MPTGEPSFAIGTVLVDLERIDMNLQLERDEIHAVRKGRHQLIEHRYHIRTVIQSPTCSMGARFPFHHHRRNVRAWSE